MRQTKPENSGKGAKRCSACGAKLWMWDSMMLKWSGPWHFQECPSIPSGNELDLRNLEERERKAGGENLESYQSNDGLSE